MNKADQIPLVDVDIANPMIWDGEQPAEGVFVAPGDSADPLDLLGTPTLKLPEESRLPADFEASLLQRSKLELIGRALEQVVSQSDGREKVDLTELDEASRDDLRLILGKGEVTGQVSLDGVRYQLTESTLPGLWHLRGDDGSEWVEVAPIPEMVEKAAASLCEAPIPLPASVPGVMNGLAVLAEVNEHAAQWAASDDYNRVLNFTLMPMSPEDQQLLIDVLGRAELVLESGGFGNCKVMATTVRHVWAVQFVNAMGNTILDTLEIGHIPDAVLAASQDFEDSARRYQQIIGTYLS